MRKLFFHAGLNKTGTSFLQERVFKPSFRENYITISSSLLPSLHSLPYDATKPLFISDERALGLTIIKRNRCRLQQQLNFLRNWHALRPDTKFIYCLRRHGEFLNSLYAQYLHLGGRTGFSEFFSYNDDAFILGAEINYSMILAELHRLFEGPHFIYNYSDMMKDQNELLSALSDFTDTDFKFISHESVVVNRSVGIRSGQILRYLNKFFNSKLHSHGRLPESIARVLFLGSTPRDVCQSVNERCRNHISSKMLNDINNYYQNDWKMAENYFWSSQVT